MEDENSTADGLSLSVKKRGYIFIIILFINLLSAKAQEPITIASFTTTNSTTGLCAPSEVEFQIDKWFNNSPGTIYVVDFGDGSPTITLSHPLNPTNTTYLLTHVYTKSSCPNQNDTATLKVINGSDTAPYALGLIVRQKPAANFDFSAACVQMPVCFTNQTQNGYTGNSCNMPAAFKWDFGDGTTSSAVNPPCHTYAAAGTYSVTLNVSNTVCGDDFIKKDVVVEPISPPPIPTPPPVYCQNQQSVPLIASGTGLLWYTSATGGVGTSTAPTPSTTTAGTKTYYVTQTLPGNCESPRVPITVTVNATPPKPVVTTPVNLCLDQPATPLTATGTNLLWYNSLTGGTGSSKAPTPPTTAIGNTLWYVSQTINGCEGPRATITVVVSIPTATINYLNAPYCRSISTPQQVSLSGTRGGVYSSDPGLSINATTGAINPSLSTPGTYVVTYTIAASPPCAGYTATTSVEIIDNPVLTFSRPVQSICSGGTAVFTFSSTTTRSTYAWSVVGSLPANISGISSGTSSDADPSISLSFTNTGTVSQNLSVLVTPTSSQNLCVSAPYNLTLTVNPAPAAPAPETFNFCMNTIPLPVLTVDPSPENTIKWYDNNLDLLTNPPVISTSAPTELIYYVSQADSYGCESPKTKILTIVHPTPSKPVIAARTPLCVGDDLVMQAYSSIVGNTALDYVWKGPGITFPANSSNIGIANVTIKDSGTYTLTVRSPQTGCSDTNNIIIQVRDCAKLLCGKSQVFIPNAFTPAGNIPENRKLIVRASGINAVKSFRVFNRWGRIVFERNNFPPNSPDFGWDGQMNGRLADSGVYVYTVDVICENGVVYSFKGNVTLL